MRDRMLRAAALAAVFVLAVAGSAVAAKCQWVGGAPNGNKSWNYMPNWDSGVIPGTNPDDVAIFSSDGTVTIDSVGGNRSIAALHFKGNTTLELKDASDVLTAKKVVVDAGCNAVISLAFVDKFSIQDTNTLIELADGADNDKLDKNIVKFLSVSGEVLSGKELDRLAKMPTKEEALSLLMACMRAPVEKLARTLNEVPGKLVRTVEAIRQSKAA